MNVGAFVIGLSQISSFLSFYEEADFNYPNDVLVNDRRGSYTEMTKFFNMCAHGVLVLSDCVPKRAKLLEINLRCTARLKIIHGDILNLLDKTLKTNT